MAYIIFHYSRLDSWIRASDEPYITGNIVSVYDDGKIITENENSLGQKVNKKLYARICMLQIEFQKSSMTIK